MFPGPLRRAPSIRPANEDTVIYLLQSTSTLQWTEIGLVIVLLIVSLGLHEAAHAWVALKCGDTTARDQGRISLDPLVHVDLFMTIILPVMLLLANAPVFGGAKPVPVNFYNLRHPHRDMALVAIAGPLTNFLLAALFWFLYKVLIIEMGVWPGNGFGARVLLQATTFNLLLAAFNLIPIPPLDGSRVVAWLLPENLREGYRRMESVGLMAIFILILFVPAFKAMLWQTIDALHGVVKYGVSLGGLW